MILPRAGVVSLLKIRRMALGAHRVPTLSDPGPMQIVVGFEFFIDIRRRKIEPLLSLSVPR